MNELENLRSLEKAISELLIRHEISEYRWITEDERCSDDNFATCLMIDGDAHFFFWELDGAEELNQVSEKFGFFVEPINNIDVGFYNIAEWNALK